jgi:hypothetical protein
LMSAVSNNGISIARCRRPFGVCSEEKGEKQKCVTTK